MVTTKVEVGMEDHFLRGRGGDKKVYLRRIKLARTDERSHLMSSGRS